MYGENSPCSEAPTACAHLLSCYGGCCESKVKKTCDSKQRGERGAREEAARGSGERKRGEEAGRERDGGSLKRIWLHTFKVVQPFKTNGSSDTSNEFWKLRPLTFS